MTAFGLAYADGSEVPDVRILSAPLPDLGGQYFPALGLLDGSQSRFPPYTTVRLYVFSRFALILMFGISLGQMVWPSCIDGRRTDA